MKVILISDVKAIGKRDQVVNVAEGYARNYLLPRNLAVPADAKHMAELQKKRGAVEAKSERNLGESKDLAQQINEAKIIIKAKVGTGTKLYGAVTHGDIAEALEKQAGIKIDKHKVEVEEPIKTLGEFEVPIRLHKDAIGHLKIEVIPA